MPKGFNHLTQDKRYQIAALKANGLSAQTIANYLKVHKTTILRELAKNTEADGSYDPIKAQQKADERKNKSVGSPKKIVGLLKERIISDLKQYWSPEQIAGRLRSEGTIISHESIYQFIWADKKSGGTLYKYLRHCGKKYNKRSGKNAGRGLIPARIDISQRPKEVEQKARIGDWEGDTIVGANHEGALLTLVDKCSKLTKIAHLPQKKSELVLAHTCSLLKELNTTVHSITFDNGKEFASHLAITKELGAQCYFATPYHSWERGLNEHTNGLIRQFLPKGTSLKDVSWEIIKFIEDTLNNRPRKALNYKTPNEVFFALRDKSPVAFAA